MTDLPARRVLPSIPVEPSALEVARAELHAAQKSHARAFGAVAWGGELGSALMPERAARVLRAVGARVVRADDARAIVGQLEASCTEGTVRELTAILQRR